MSFREKSAWVMSLVIAGTGIWYYLVVTAASDALGHTAPPIGPLIGYVVMVAIISAVSQIILALLSPREAGAPADERERGMIDRAGNWSGYVLSVGIFSALGNYLFINDGNLLFHLVMGAMIVATLADYLFLILLYRRGN
ncbi:hypothetical protein [Sphingomonas sp.]|uniref:hypothetical protein n=1 Tax=Sphingomonas sp. TaxID=28214 RepID=UPI003D6DA3FC